MENYENERTNVTGLDNAANRKEAEYDLVQALLEATEYKTDEENVSEVDIKRNGKFLFRVHMHPISDSDVRQARKKATSYVPNPNGKKLPKIESDFNSTKFNSWLIYLATTEEDQTSIWGNPAIMKKFMLAEPAESIDVLLTVGEKRRLSDIVSEISGLDDDDTEEETKDTEEYAKN